MLNKILFTLLGFVCSIAANSQSKTMVGIKTDAFSTLHEYFKTSPSVSLTLNRIYNEHHGIETGLIYFREENTHYFSHLTAYSTNFKINRHYLSLPLSYKYYSPKLCFSAGMSINQYLGWTSSESDKIINGLPALVLLINSRLEKRMRPEINPNLTPNQLT